LIFEFDLDPPVEIYGSRAPEQRGRAEKKMTENLKGDVDWKGSIGPTSGGRW